MNPFRTVQNAFLSLWQSSVRSGFENSDQLSEVDEATAQYCQSVFQFANEHEHYETNELFDWWQKNADGKDREVLAVTALNHFIAMAQSENDVPLETAARRRYRNFEEGKGNWWQWKKCILDYKRYQLRTRNGPAYRSPMFDGELMRDFSVIDDLLPEDRPVRIALVGDWGTGEPEAKAVLKAIDAQKPDLLIHLGDIYFSGTKEECRRYFLDLLHGTSWCAHRPVFTLAGNHDYYSGGEGFYQLIDHLNPPASRQAASFFCLRNRYWQLLVMDTGVNDCSPLSGLRSYLTLGQRPHVTTLREDERQWHLNRLKNAQGRQTILLSHHQLFSAYEPIGKVSAGQVSLNSKLDWIFNPYFKPSPSGETWVRAWFWGHEHDFVTFTPGFQDLAFGACLGHGAIPVNSRFHPRPQIPSPYPGIRRDPSPTALSVDQDYYRHGFSVLTLQGNLSAKIEHFQVVDAAGKAVPLESPTKF